MFTMLYKEKHQEISLFYTCVPKILMIWSTQFLRYRVWQTEIGNYESFFALLSPLKSKKIRIWKNEKYCWRYHHFTQMYQKSQLNEVQFLR